MSKIGDKLIDGEILDTFKFHPFHQSYHSDCSECYAENRKIQAWKVVNDKKIRKELNI